MDWKSFVSQMTSALAWPLAIGLIAWTFRSEIRHFLKNVKKLGAAGISVEIADLIQKSGEQLEHVVQKTAITEPRKKRDYVLVEEFPEAAVLQEFQELSDILLQIRERLPDDRPHRNLIEVVNWLHKSGRIPDSVRSSFIALQKTTNFVKHSKGPDRVAPGEAIEIVRQLAVLRDVFTGVLDKLPQPTKRI